MHWKPNSWILVGLLLAALTATAGAQLTTTQVADTIYHADGTTATGTLLISWPAFTTSSGVAIPSGSTSTAIASGGALSVELVPNAGSTPIGSYYTVVYHLDDGSTSRQYWAIPVSSTSVKVSAVESTVLPTSVAMQTVSKSYVDTAIARAVTTVNATTVAAQVSTSRLPRVDVTYPGFGADPTCTTDSTAAIQAAYTYALTQETASLAIPIVYFPHGCYLISGVLRWSGDIGIEGDGPSATAIKLTNNTANGFTIAGSTLSDWTSQGFMRDLSIVAANNHSYTADELELLNVSGYRLEDIAIWNGGGRGINAVGNTERISAHDIYINAVRYPLITLGNENKWLSLQINAPGMAGDNYCFDVNCVGGVWPTLGWNNAQVLTSAIGSGSTLTAVVAGGSNSATNNGVSPVLVGHHFQIAGATGTTCVNGVWTVAAVANSSPSSGHFTVTATAGISSTGTPSTVSGCTGTATVSGATFKPAILPARNPAVSVGGDMPYISGGSLKSIQHSAGFVTATNGGTINDIYVENFVSGAPSENSGLETPGLPFHTATTAALPATTAPAAVAVADTSWFQLYVNDPGDASAVSNQGPDLRILPCDYLLGSTAASTCAGLSGVQRGQYENATGIATGGSSVSLIARNLSGSTAPSGTAWPSGSIIAEQVASVYDALTFKNMHVSDAGGPGNGFWFPECIDGTPYVCGEAIVGNIPNEITSFSQGENAAHGYIGGVQGSVAVEGGTWYTCTVCENNPSGTLKFSGVGGTASVVSGPQIVGNTAAQDENAVTTGNMLQGEGGPQEVNAQGTDGSWPNVTFKNLNDGTDLSTGGTNPGTYSKRVDSYQDPIAGGIDANNWFYGMQFANQWSIADTPATTNGHSNVRWDWYGGPTQTPGWKQSKWGGSSWTTLFSTDNLGNFYAALSVTAPTLVASTSLWSNYVQSNGYTNGILTLYGEGEGVAYTSNTEQIQLYGYAYTGVTGAGGQVFMHGTNSSVNFILDSGSSPSSHNGNAGFGWPLGTNIPNAPGGSGALAVRYNMGFACDGGCKSGVDQNGIYSEPLTTPSSSSATCFAGQFTDDANYHYVCTATNTWKRAALSTF